MDWFYTNRIKVHRIKVYLDVVYIMNRCQLFVCWFGFIYIDSRGSYKFK
ncbi:hypothetical protein HanIR_Chr15g0759561 [Helianthus annuus]|nr:hypothetical protein HanIR_Chr15g0759561 [Helianthus annuus]